jgi:hypothetical protein
MEHNTKVNGKMIFSMVKV